VITKFNEDTSGSKRKPEQVKGQKKEEGKPVEVEGVEE